MSRLIAFAVSFFILVALLTACGEDSEAYYYSSPFRLEFGTASTTNSGTTIYTDNGDTLSSSLLATFGFSADDGQRVVANYSIASDGSFSINSISSIHTSQVFSSSQDTLSYAPITVQSIWRAGSYVNLIFTFNRYSTTHNVSLCRLTNSPDTIRLSHSKNGDSEGYPVRVYMSVLLDVLSSDSIPVKIATESGMVVYKI